MYENLQRFVLRTFELSFLELLFLGFPISIYTIIGTLAGLTVPAFLPVLVAMIGSVWLASYVAMWMLTDVWTIPMDEKGIVQRIPDKMRP